MFGQNEVKGKNQRRATYLNFFFIFRCYKRCIKSSFCSLKESMFNPERLVHNNMSDSFVAIRNVNSNAHEVARITKKAHNWKIVDVAVTMKGLGQIINSTVGSSSF